jgi:hypothetical protein
MTAGVPRKSGASIIPTRVMETGAGVTGTDTKTSVAGTLTDIPTPGIEVIRTAGGIPLIPDLAGITTVTTTAISQLPVRALSRKS